MQDNTQDFGRPLTPQPEYTEFEKGERAALLQVRSFIIKHGKSQVDAFCAQRLHDIAMDAQLLPGASQ